MKYSEKLIGFKIFFLKSKLKVLLSLFTILLPIFSSFGDEPPVVYHLRAPRSGSHWFFYCCNTIFNKTIFADGDLSPYKSNAYHLRREGKIITAHNPFDLHLNKNSHENDLLILLIRNYRECLLREYQDPESVKNEITYQASFNDLSSDLEWVLSLRMNHYFHNLRVFDIWNPEKRLLVYYEDLLQYPQETLLLIADFFGENEKKSEIVAFVENIDEHMENSLNIYEGPAGGYKSYTRGRSFLYHTNRVGIEKSLEIDQLVKKYFPEFLEKYLSRYPLDVNENK